MKKIIFLFLTMLIFSIAAICNCYATPILWSSSTVDLANLNIITTDTLSISLDNSMPEQLVARAEVYLEDLEPYNNLTYNWTGYDFSANNYTIPFTATGSGELGISVETRWQYGIAPWALPDRVLADDSHWTYFRLTNEDTGETANGGNSGYYHFSVFDQTYIFASYPDIFFKEGQTGSITFSNLVHAGGYYTELPSQPVPVPEPTSILLLGAGLIGFVKLRKIDNRVRARGKM